MPYAPIEGNPQLAGADIKGRTTKVLLTIKTAATAGSVNITSDNPGVVPYWVGSGTPTDAGTNFPSLTNTSSSVIGLLINDGKLASYRFSKKDINPTLTPSITNVTVVADGASSSGVTASGNGALGLTLTGLTLVATATTQYLGFEAEFYIS